MLLNFGAAGDILVEKGSLALLFHAELGLLYPRDDTTQAQQRFMIEFGPFLVFGFQVFPSLEVLPWTRFVLQLALMI